VNKPDRTLLLVLLLAALVACNSQLEPSVDSQLCSSAWNKAVEAALGSGDGAGHGPDIGSDEWMSVVEFKLGVRGGDDLPPRGSEAWCKYVDNRLQSLP